MTGRVRGAYTPVTVLRVITVSGNCQKSEREKISEIWYQQKQLLWYWTSAYYLSAVYASKHFAFHCCFFFYGILMIALFSDGWGWANSYRQMNALSWSCIYFIYHEHYQSVHHWDYFLFHATITSGRSLL